jgi:hypothetical protein
MFTEEEMLDSIRTVAKVIGYLPSIKKYETIREEALKAWLDESHENVEGFANGTKIFPWPSAMTIRNRCGGWSQAITPLREEFPSTFKKQDVSFLRQLIKERGRSVTEKEYEEARRDQNPEAPHSASLMKGFGSWTATLQAAGTEPTHYQYWSNEDLLDMVLTLAVQIGRMPSVSEYEAVAARRDWPAPRQLYRRFKSWPNIAKLIDPALKAKLAEPGYEPDQDCLRAIVKTKPERKLDLSCLKALGSELGRRPRLNEYNAARSKAENPRTWPSMKEIKKFHKSWKGACDAAGLPQ